MSIQRYRIEPYNDHGRSFPYDNGKWVYYSDHEAAVREAVAEERAKIVARLRRQQELASSPPMGVYLKGHTRALEMAADAIERGEHAKETP